MGDWLSVMIRIWLWGVAIVALLVGLVIGCCIGCSSPGTAARSQVRAENDGVRMLAASAVQPDVAQVQPVQAAHQPVPDPISTAIEDHASSVPLAPPLPPEPSPYVPPHDPQPEPVWVKYTQPAPTPTAPEVCTKRNGCQRQAAAAPKRVAPVARFVPRCRGPLCRFRVFR